MSAHEARTVTMGDDPTGFCPDLDAILARSRVPRDLPAEAWAFDRRLGVCRRVRWDDAREPLSVRRTALAVATLEALTRRWELN